MKTESLYSVAKKTGYSYAALRSQVNKYEKQLIAKGVLQVEERLAKKKYFVLVQPEEFIEVLKKLIREGKNEK